MNKFIRTIFAVISIMLALTGCNQSEPDSDTQGSQQQSTPTSQPTQTQTGTRISASSLSDLQTQIDDAQAEADLDLSLCSNIRGSLTVKKSLTLRNFTSNADIIVTEKNVTLSNSTVNSVTTQQSGSSSLRITNSSLSTLTLSGDGQARSGSRAAADKPKSLIFDTIVTGTLCFNEAVELDIANVGLNIGSFTSNAEATINMTESAYEEYQSKYSSGNLNISANGNITDETMYSYLDEYGFAGENFYFKTKSFPSDCVGYISKLLKKYKSDAPNVPAPSPTSEDDYFQYYWSTYSQNMGIVTTDGAVLWVDFPKDTNFDKEAYENALISVGFTDSPSGLAYSNEEEIENKIEELSKKIDETNSTTAIAEIQQTISNMVIYNIEVVIDWYWYYGENDDEDATPVYSIEYIFYAMKYGDLYGNYFNY